MKKLFLLLIGLTTFTGFAQEDLPNNFAGTWQTVSVDTGDILLDVKTGAVTMTDKAKKLHPTATGQQDAAAYVRTLYSKNRFVFGNDGEFYYYQTEKENTQQFEGSYVADTAKKVLHLSLVNRTGHEVIKEVPYEFVDGKLRLVWDKSKTDPGIVYVTERVK